MAAEDNFVHGGCHGSDTMLRLKDITKNVYSLPSLTQRLCVTAYI